MLINGAQTDELLEKLAELSELDAELVKRCGSLIQAEHYDEAVTQAFILLQGRLLQLGCVRTAPLSTPIRLDLQRRSDQAVLDRIYELFKEVMDNYRA